MKFKLFFVFALALSLSLVYVFGFRQDSPQLRTSLMTAIHGSRAEAATISQKTTSDSDNEQASLTPINSESDQTLGKMGSESDVLRASLIKAVRSDNVDLTKKLIKMGADVNGRSTDGSTALMMAAGYGYTDILNLLLDRGANAHAQMSDGSNALTFAVLGANDIDRFTAVDCQGLTIKALIDRVPDLKLQGSARVLRTVASAKLKSCAGFAQLLGTRYP